MRDKFVGIHHRSTFQASRECGRNRVLSREGCPQRMRKGSTARAIDNVPLPLLTMVAPYATVELAQ